MNTKKFTEALGELDSKYIEEAILYKKKGRRHVWVKRGMIAACIAAVAVVGCLFVSFPGGMAVSAYAYGIDEEITAAGAVMIGGTISDTGKMKGSPLMFYLSGKDIASVRFSCKNQQINFLDWTEKRDEYGNAQNFTVAYGEDESEYYYLTINWIPNTLIRELTDNTDSRIATLPEEMRHDIIVMEITFENGKTMTKAITVSLLDDGTFFAVFDDYEISEADAFVKRPDSEAIPRDILYAEGSVSVSDAAPMIYVNDALYKQSPAQTYYSEWKDDFVYLGVIESDITALQGTGGALDGVPKENFQANHPIVGAGVYQFSDDIVVETEGKYWLYEAVSGSNSNKESGLSREEKMLPDPSYGAGNMTKITYALNELEYRPYTCDGLPEYELTSEDGTVYSMNFSEKWVWRGKDEQADLPDEIISWLQALDGAVRAYYENTVFEVISLKLKSETENEITFLVRVSKGGAVQEPDRMIVLQLNSGTWEVINEGY